MIGAGEGQVTIFGDPVTAVATFEGVGIIDPARGPALILMSSFTPEDVWKWIDSRLIYHQSFEQSGTDERTIGRLRVTVDYEIKEGGVVELLLGIAGA